MMQSYNNRTQKLTLLGCDLALALVLSYVESLIPITIGLPGVKLGLANLAILLILYLYDTKSAIVIDILRVVLVAFLFGNFSSMLYSMAGAGLSFILMIGMKKMNFEKWTVSIGGGIAHNVGQLLLARIVLQSQGIWLNLPWLIIAGCVTGAVIGVVCCAVYPYLRRFVER